MDVEAAQHVKGGASNATEPTAGGRHAVDESDFGKTMLDEITQLKKKQKEAREIKVAIAKKLRNAERRRKRLKQRAKQLSDADLLAVISLRNHEKAAGQNDGEEEEEDDDENAEINPDDSGAGPSSSGATPKASRTSKTKKRRG